MRRGLETYFFRKRPSCAMRVKEIHLKTFEITTFSWETCPVKKIEDVFDGSR